MHASVLTDDLRKCAEQARADLVGIAPIDRFDGLAPDRDPRAIFPECRSVIVLGRRILRGALRGVEEGTSFSSTYGLFGYHWLEDNFLAQTTYDVTCHIETLGYEAVPLFGYAESGMPKGRPVAPGKPAPNIILDVAYAAQAAGLGAPGLGDFFITPRFGIRQRFALILTDADLTPDPVLEKPLCGDCGACIRACPLGGLRADRLKSAGIPGHERQVAAIDLEICNACPNGAMRLPGRGTQPDRIAAACGRACMVQIEQGGKCENRFAQPFRKRTPWALDLLQRPLAPDAAANPANIGCGKNLDTLGQGRA
ncbi:MAG: hypothetical protein WC708_05250 [Lentisphaeria bacterium]